MALPLPVFGGRTPTKEVSTGSLVTAGIEYVPAKNAHYDYFVPEMWAKESLGILEENMVIANLVHRDQKKLFDTPLKCGRVNVGNKPNI